MRGVKKRLSWRLAVESDESEKRLSVGETQATKTLEGVLLEREGVTLGEEREEVVRAQEARKCEKNEKRAREARKTLREECEREKRAQVARVSPEKDWMMKTFLVRQFEKPQPRLQGGEWRL